MRRSADYRRELRAVERSIRPEKPIASATPSIDQIVYDAVSAIGRIQPNLVATADQLIAKRKLADILGYWP